jgi:hypothetical protein
MSRKMGRAPQAAVLAIVGAAILAGCDAADAEWAGICEQEHTKVRLDDQACGDYDETGAGGGHGAYWMWVSTGSNTYIPPVGSKIPPNVGTRTVAAGTPIAKGVATAGQTVQRGGFGVKAGSTGGTGAKAGGSGGS